VTASSVRYLEIFAVDLGDLGWPFAPVRRTGHIDPLRTSRSLLSGHFRAQEADAVEVRPDQVTAGSVPARILRPDPLHRCPLPKYR